MDIKIDRTRGKFEFHLLTKEARLWGIMHAKGVMWADYGFYASNPNVLIHAAHQAGLSIDINGVR